MAAARVGNDEIELLLIELTGAGLGNLDRIIIVEIDHVVRNVGLESVLHKLLAGAGADGRSASSGPTPSAPVLIKITKFCACCGLAGTTKANHGLHVNVGVALRRLEGLRLGIEH